MDRQSLTEFSTHARSTLHTENNPSPKCSKCRRTERETERERERDRKHNRGNKNKTKVKKNNKKCNRKWVTIHATKVLQKKLTEEWLRLSLQELSERCTHFTTTYVNMQTIYNNSKYNTNVITIMTATCRIFGRTPTAPSTIRHTSFWPR